MLPAALPHAKHIEGRHGACEERRRPLIDGLSPRSERDGCNPRGGESDRGGEAGRAAADDGHVGTQRLSARILHSFLASSCYSKRWIGMRVNPVRRSVWGTKFARPSRGFRGPYL